MQAEVIKHKILLILMALTILGEVISVLMWTLLPDLRFTVLNFELGVINAGVMIVLNLIAFY
jgi:hypothetical protein